MSPEFRRITWRAFLDIVSVRGWIVAFLLPVIFVVFFLVVPVLVLTAAERLNRRVEADGQTASREKVLVALVPGASEQTQALYDDLASALAEDARPLSGTEEMDTLLRFVGSTRRPYPARDFTTSRPAVQARNRFPRYLDVARVPDAASHAALASRVPSEGDAALTLQETDPGRARYWIAWDPGNLDSQAVHDLVEERLDHFSRERRNGSPQRALSFEIVDHVAAEPDYWVVRVGALVLLALLLMAYQTIGIQGAVALLAGERERRTLEVLLSLPLTLRQVLYGKALALAVATALPVIFWGAWPWLLYRALGIPLAGANLAALAFGLLAFQCSLGCAVSGSSPSTSVAGNRLSAVNLALGLVVAGVLALPGLHPMAALLAISSGAPGSIPMVVGALVVLLGGAVVALEVGHAVMRRG